MDWSGKANQVAKTLYLRYIAQLKGKVICADGLQRRQTNASKLQDEEVLNERRCQTAL